MPEIVFSVRSNGMKHVLFFIFFLSSVATGQILRDEVHHQLLLKGIHFTLEQQYDSAETAFRTIIRKYPKHPSGYLYLAGMYQARCTDYGDSFNPKRYDSLLTAAGTLAEVLMKNNSTAAEGYYYSGASDAFRSYTASENGNLPTGFYYGISAGNLLEQCLIIDPKYVQAKNILGSYYYWRSKLAWIPFVSDRSQEGIALILESLVHPYEKHLASHNLMLIFIDEKRFSDAERYGVEMLQRYPDNRLFLWNLMTVYEQWGKEDKLNDIVHRLLQSTMSAPVINRYTEATCRLKLAQFAFSKNERPLAAAECDSILALSRFVGKTKGDLKKKITAAEKLKATINNE